MSRPFCPDYGVLPTAAGYRPMATLYRGEPLKLCFYKGGPKHFPSAHQAREAAKDYVQQQINKIRASDLVEPSEPQDPLGTTAWIAGRAERHQAEVSRAFGANKLFIKGRTVQVEHRRRRA